MSAHHLESCSACSCSHDSAPKETPITDIPKGHHRDVFIIEAMDCPTEEGLIRRHFANDPLIDQLSFNLIQRKLTVVHNTTTQYIIDAIAELGMEAISEMAASTPTPPKKAFTGSFIIAALSAAAAEILSLFDVPLIIVGFFAILAIVLCGKETYIKGWISLKNRKLNINALMSVAVTGAVLIGELPEAAMVMVLFNLSEMLEARSLDRARNAIAGLMSLTPDEALVLDHGTASMRPVEAIAKGSTIRVMPGARIPLDGTITKGSSSIDESPITGESLPIDKTVGDAVYAGSINFEREIEFVTTTTSDNSTLSKIARTIEEAQSQRAPVERFVDQFAAIYTPIVFAIAILVALISPLFGVPVIQSIYNALVMLIIACPCALVISTPVAIVSGLTTAARQGILIKGGSYLETARHIKGLALDKTGTLTEGQPTVTEVITLVHSTHIPSIAAHLAARSDHPMSKAVAAHYQSALNAPLTLHAFTVILGQGTCASIEGAHYYLGNLKLMHAYHIDVSGADTHLARLNDHTGSLLFLADDAKLLAIFVLEDAIKPTTRKAIDALHRLGLSLTILSGDRERTVKNVATALHLDAARGEQLPEDKLAFIDDFQKNHGAIAMIGDGINDAPALAKADIGFAMGGMGSDTAIETADVAIMDDDLMKVPNFFHISERTIGIIRQNITFAIVVKLFFFLLALFGLAEMWMAVIADVGTTFLVVLNALRLLKVKEIQ